MPDSKTEVFFHNLTKTPAVMGILNVTPDSFSDGGMYSSVEHAMDRIFVMLKEGASVIDIGGESTRPNADSVSGAEELDRVLPVLERAIAYFPQAVFSVDTTKRRVAKASLEAGAHIINDISGLQNDPGIADACAAFGAGLVIMHSRGNPKTMQKNPEYTNVVPEVHSFLKTQVSLAKAKGVKHIVLDPGVGFGKNLHHNLELLSQLDTFCGEFPVLVGVSRKSMIGHILKNREVSGRLAGTLAVQYHCLMKGARILRVHDVQEAVDSINVFAALEPNRNSF